MHQADLLNYNNLNYRFGLELDLQVFETSFTYVLMITTDYIGFQDTIIPFMFGSFTLHCHRLPVADLQSLSSWTQSLVAVK
jgi:hypothetical protein